MYEMNSGWGFTWQKQKIAIVPVVPLYRVENRLNYSGCELWDVIVNNDYSCKMFVIKGCLLADCTVVLLSL